MGGQENDFISACRLGMLMYVQMALRAAIELNVFDIIASSGPNTQLSSAEIVSKLPTTNPNASNILERILRLLGVNSILTMSSRPSQEDNNGQLITTYGLTNESRSFVKNCKGVSASSFIIFNSEKVILECLYTLKDSVLNARPESIYQAHHGKSIFDDISQSPKLGCAFNDALSFFTGTLINMMLRLYKGFEGVSELMDVGGNIGGTVAKIAALYPNIRFVNFDLPHVVASAPKHPRVEHVGGDMFVSLPKAQTIFMKQILHDWNDDQCIKILSNCWKALPDNGKLIIFECLIPEIPEENIDFKFGTTIDFMMMVQMDGKERKLSEYDDIAKAAGFKERKVYPIGLGFHVIEFFKTNK